MWHLYVTLRIEPKIDSMENGKHKQQWNTIQSNDEKKNKMSYSPFERQCITCKIWVKIIKADCVGIIEWIYFSGSNPEATNALDVINTSKPFLNNKICLDANGKQGCYMKP